MVMLFVSCFVWKIDVSAIAVRDGVSCLEG